MTTRSHFRPGDRVKNLPEINAINPDAVYDVVEMDPLNSERVILAGYGSFPADAFMLVGLHWHKLEPLANDLVSDYRNAT